MKSQELLITGWWKNCHQMGYISNHFIPFIKYIILILNYFSKCNMLINDVLCLLSITLLMFIILHDLHITLLWFTAVFDLTDGNNTKAKCDKILEQKYTRGYCLKIGLKPVKTGTQVQMLDKIHFTLNGIDLDHFTLLPALEDGGDHGGAPAGPVLREHQVELVVGPHQLKLDLGL